MQCDQIEAIVKQSYMADNIPFAVGCRAGGVRGRIIVGQDDHILDPSSAEALSAAAGFGAASVYEGCSHAVTIEADRKWRKEVIEFLDAN
jgi:pimeloyl-ACP methyl ester carboxylesterase